MYFCATYWAGATRAGTIHVFAIHFCHDNLILQYYRLSNIQHTMIPVIFWAVLCHMCILYLVIIKHGVITVFSWSRTNFFCRSRCTIWNMVTKHFTWDNFNIHPTHGGDKLLFGVDRQKCWTSLCQLTLWTPFTDSSAQASLLNSLTPTEMCI